MSTIPNQTEPPDPLAKLHRMSTTAGVASQQYVAVNTTAVIAALLGVASGLAVFSQTLLIIPVAAIVCAIVAWRQIADSNGTETGKGLAIGGLLLSLLIGGGIFGKQLLASARARADGHAMEAIVAQLNDDLRAGNYAEAYQLFSVTFRTRVSQDAFTDRWRASVDPSYYGPLLAMTWNNVPPAYESAQGGDVTYGVIYVAISFKRTDSRFTFAFRKVGDAWQLENIVEMFPVERQKPAPKQ